MTTPEARAAADKAAQAAYLALEDGSVEQVTAAFANMFLAGSEWRAPRERVAELEGLHNALPHIADVPMWVEQRIASLKASRTDSK